MTDHPYHGARAVLPTQHGKGRAIARPRPDGLVGARAVHCGCGDP